MGASPLKKSDRGPLLDLNMLMVKHVKKTIHIPYPQQTD